MLDARERPGRRNDQDVRLIFERELSIQLWKTEVITNAQSETESAGGSTRESIARRKTCPLVIGSEREEMRLPVAGRNAAARIDEDLRIVNGRAGPFRDTAHNNERKFFRHFLKRGHGAFGPRLCLCAN